MKTINDHWNHFESLVLPKNCPQIQRVEMKRAFFAGFTTAIDALSFDVSELPEDEGVKALESFMNQAVGFAEAVKLGAA